MILPSSRTRLKPQNVDAFPGETLFARVARALCMENCIPRKELYESWEVARRTRRRFRGGRVVDLAAGHGLVAHLMLLLDDASPAAFCVDKRVPPSAHRIAGAFARAWPRLEGRVQHVEGDVDAFPLTAGDVVVSAHACGRLTDVVLARAVEARARVAVLPCCHDEDTCDAGGLLGWLELGAAVDATRARRLASEGYRVVTQTIPAEITPKNRLLLGEPEREPERTSAFPPGGLTR